MAPPSTRAVLLATEQLVRRRSDRRRPAAGWYSAQAPHLLPAAPPTRVAEACRQESSGQTGTRRLVTFLASQLPS